MCNITKQIEILNNICPLEKGYKNSKRLIRQRFFENIETEIQAYLLGFYVADGSLNDKRNTLRIHINSGDSEIIELFKTFISPDALVKQIDKIDYIASENKTIHTKESIQIDISNKMLASSLTRLGYGSNKTYKELSLPKLNDELLIHFIRGYFDGDGCFTSCIRKPNIKNREKNYRISANINLVSKTNTLLNEIAAFLTKFEINTSVYYHQRYNCYRLYISGKDSIKKFYKLLYSDSNYYLKRKFEKINHHVNTEVTQLIDEYRNA